MFPGAFFPLIRTASFQTFSGDVFGVCLSPLPPFSYCIAIVFACFCCCCVLVHKTFVNQNRVCGQMAFSESIAGEAARYQSSKHPISNLHQQTSNLHNLPLPANVGEVVVGGVMCGTLKKASSHFSPSVKDKPNRRYVKAAMEWN